MVDPGKGCKCFGVQPNELVIKYLNWAFRNSFMAFIMSAAIFYYVWCIWFALLILGSGLHKPECISADGLNFKEAGSFFANAFSLSWQTFSTTVGRFQDEENLC